jgi:putative phage-type endonuclease
MIEQRSDDWFAARLGKVTASRVADVMAKGRGSAPSASRRNYMMQLLCERLTGKREEGYTSAAMQRGVDLEPIARSAYEFNAGVMTVEVGLMQHPRIAGFAASPDGMILLPPKKRGLEIKVPNTAQHIAVLQSGKHDPQYEWQMLAQMACGGFEAVDFVSFDDRLPEELQYFCARFERDDKRIAEMEAEVTAFLEELNELERDMRGRMAA